MFVCSIVAGIVVWSVVAFDWSLWAKVLGYLLRSRPMPVSRG